MTPWVGTNSNAGGPRNIGWTGGELGSTEMLPRGDSTGGDWGWVGDALVSLLGELLGAREGVASHATSQSFSLPVNAAERDGCRCCCIGDLGTASAPVSRHPTSPRAENTTLSTAAGPSFESEVRGQAPREIDLELAQMAQDVYDLDSQGIDGWTRLDDAQLEAANIDPEMLEDPETGYRAAIYTDGEGRYVLAFAGTDAKSVPDWIANFGQGLGFDVDQYEQAVDLARLAKSAFGDDLVITGHSLGGGLAAAAGLGTDSPAVTFNAAGLHDNTIRGFDLDPDTAEAMAEGGQIRNYVVDGEALTHVQEESSSLAPFAPDAVGSQIELADPHSFWEHLNPLNLWDVSHRVRLHLMDSVLDALQQDRPWEHSADAA